MIIELANKSNSASLVLFLMFLPTILVIVVPIVLAIKKRLDFQNSEYYLTTTNSYDDLLYDKGKSGEYQTFAYLNQLEGMKRFVFNCYIPKNDGTTTEIDIIMIHEKGIFVFESKNYSGWIFGRESDNYWTQSLMVGRGKTEKHKFYNPIKQNNSHIKWLQNYLGLPSTIFRSYVVFSERCTLKSVTVDSSNVYVIKRNQIYQYVGGNLPQLMTRLSGEEIDEIYNKLYVHTLKTQEQKIEHINQINNHNSYKQ